MAVITISRQFGAGGDKLARALVDKLGYQYVSRDVLKKVAARGGVSMSGAAAAEKSAGSWIMGLVDKIFPRDYIDSLLKTDSGLMDSHDYIATVTEVITEIAQKGDAVILGRGGQHILKHLPGAFHVLLVADHEFRLKQAMEYYQATDKEAKAALKAHDRRRNSYLRAFVDIDPNDPSLYHLTINTARTPMERAEHLILELIAD
ncbi:MAG: cytidylate kinase-like family protein [Proteobacteria bacterium]|nr:cytidylate kinase-like family protein [Pseudomonadota bacterium]